MKLDSERLKIYAKLPDNILWSQIVSIGEKNGLHLPTKVPSKDIMAKLRRVMTGEESIGLSDAMTLLNNYKNTQGGGRQ